MFNEFVYQNLKIAETDEVSVKFLSNTEKHYNIVKVFASAQNKHFKLLFNLMGGGYYFVDRTLDVSITLSKVNDYERLIRLPIVKTTGYKKEILQIAQKSFPYDRRFHLQLNYNQQFANVVIADWVNRLGEVYVCLYKDMPIGFLALIQIDDKNSFVHLAAVDEEYRMTGAAMALYAKAIQVSKEKKYLNLNGRISSKNIAVMNLYANFGAKFSNPIDIYIKEV